MSLGSVVVLYQSDWALSLQAASLLKSYVVPLGALKIVKCSAGKDWSQKRIAQGTSNGNHVISELDYLFIVQLVIMFAWIRLCV